MSLEAIKEYIEIERHGNEDLINELAYSGNNDIGKAQWHHGYYAACVNILDFTDNIQKERIQWKKT